MKILLLVAMGVLLLSSCGKKKSCKKEDNIGTWQYCDFIYVDGTKVKRCENSTQICLLWPNHMGGQRSCRLKR